MKRTFGAKPRKPTERIEFDLIVQRDGEPETHTFGARPVADIGGLSYLMLESDRAPQKAIGTMMTVIARMLDNRDGTPSKWSPTALPAPSAEDQAGDGTYGERPAQKFRAPDGSLQPAAKADEYLKFENGSSRRRWIELLRDDDGVTVEADDLEEVLEYLLSVAGKDHTQHSS